MYGEAKRKIRTVIIAVALSQIADRLSIRINGLTYPSNLPIGLPDKIRLQTSL